MNQLAFSEAQYSNKKFRETSLERMDKLIPWKRLDKTVVRYYPKDQSGRPLYPLFVTSQTPVV